MSMSRGIRRGLTLGAPLLATALAALTIGAALPSQATGPFDRAGTAAFPAGSAGIVVTFSAPMLNTSYAVTVQQTNTAGYSPTAACTYFNVLKKTTAGFQVQHKECATGLPQPLVVGVSLDWIAIPYA